MTEDELPFYSQVYHDPDTGQPISTHSMLKTMRTCPRQAYYKYVLRLKPQLLGRPLRFGTWMHELLEVHYKGEDWRERHQHLSHQFSNLFDEEKERVGNLPSDCERTMKSYLWHYQEDPWTVHDVEFTLDVELPDGSIYRCKIDMLVENQYGLWIVDHKNHKTLPDHGFRILDSQSALYIWAALKNGIPVNGHIWNYLRSKPPAIPQMLKDGSRLSKRVVDTDYPSMVKAIKNNGLDPRPYHQQLKRYKGQQYKPGELQTSPFFRRDVLEKSPRMLKQVASEAFQTHLRMHHYHWDRVNLIERNPSNSCKFMCSYLDVCTAELFTGSADLVIRSKYKHGDPLDYYQDEKERSND